MIRRGSPVALLNAGLLGILAGLRHGDTVVLADAGMPCPAGVPEIDLSVTAGLPSLAGVLGPVLEALAVESAVIADEWRLAGRLPGDMHPGLAAVPVSEVSHTDLKALTARAHALVRTGETTPYANVVLVAGVTF